MVTAVRLVSVLLAIGILLTGCKDYDIRKRESALDETVRLYVRAVRWSDLATAAALIRSRSGPVPPVDGSRYEGLKVTAYEVNLESHERGDETAKMLAVFKYYYEDDPRLRTQNNAGVWWFDEASERWFLDGELPPFPR